MERNVDILEHQINILKYLLLWPNSCLSSSANKCLLYGFFCLSISFSIPVVLAILHQIQEGIYDLRIFLETLIGVCDIIGYMVAYACFLKNKEKIECLLNDINAFLDYCPRRTIQQTDSLCHRYTKYILLYVTIGITFNICWPLMSRKKCIAQSVSDFYLKHDPCGMATHNFYPFNASDPTLFWIVFSIEGIYICHICYVFSMVTAVILGLLIHITAQLKRCGNKFQHIYYDKPNSSKREFILCVKYHQATLEYAERTFSIFSGVASAYVIVTSFAAAVIGYQIVETGNIQDRLRYAMLLLAWSLLFFLICFHVQNVQDQSLAIANSVYKGKWNTSSNMELRKLIMIVIARSQHPLYFKIPYLGIISLVRFVAVMKWAYSFFTILLTAAEKN